MEYQIINNNKKRILTHRPMHYFLFPPMLNPSITLWCLSLGPSVSTRHHSLLMDYFQMQCSLDSGLIVVVFIVACLLWVVGLLLFYEFEDVCDRIKFQANDTNMVIKPVNVLMDCNPIFFTSSDLQFFRHDTVTISTKMTL